MDDMNMKRRRETLFSRIAQEILPEAEKRVAAIKPFAVMDMPMFGSKPGIKAFSSGGELRFDLGMWTGERFERFDPQILFPLHPESLKFDYPKELAFSRGSRYVNAHYTPVTRRLDCIEVQDMFTVARVEDKLVRGKALGLLAEEIAKVHPAQEVETYIKYIRYAEQYVVVTGIRSRAFAAAGTEEYAAIERVSNA